MQRIILIPDRIKKNVEIEKEIFGKGYKIITQDKKIAEEIPVEIWQSADAILAWHEINYDTDLISKLRNCKIIVRVGVGYDNVDLESAKNKGIAVCNVPDYGTNDVADHTMALLLSLCRATQAYDEHIRKNRSWEWDSIGNLKRLNGLTIGIIGLGMVSVYSASLVPKPPARRMTFTLCSSLLKFHLNLFSGLLRDHGEYPLYCRPCSSLPTNL